MAIPLLVPILVLLAGSALVVQHFVQPRLPVYTLTLMSPWPFGVVRKSATTGQWVTSISTNVELFNANFLHLDVYAVSFDLYGERLVKPRESDNDKQDNDATVVVLQHIGNLQDENQHIVPVTAAPIIAASTNKDSPRSSGSGSTRTTGMAHAMEVELPVVEQPNNVEPLWSIAPRANFSSTTNLYMSMASSSSSSSSGSSSSGGGGGGACNTVAVMVQVLYRLVSRWWNGSGRLTVVTTGVAHLKASTTTASSSSSSGSSTSSWLGSSFNGPLLQAPLTVSIICDNHVDTWQWTVVGTSCTLYSMVPGWLDLPTAAAAVRRHAQTQLTVHPATGSVLHAPA
jgi:uncharacterized membrane protein YgcG